MALSGAIRAGRAFVEIGANDAPLRAQMAKLEAKLAGFGRRLALVGGAMVGLAGTAAGALSWPLQLAANLEQTETSFRVLLGSGEAAQKLLEELQEFAASTPFQFTELANAARSLVAFGSSAGEVTGELRRLGDVASGVGIPLGELAEIYGKARTQGRLFQEDINQLAGRGIPIYAQLAAQFGVAESEVRKLVESGQIGFGNLEQAMVDLTSEGGQFFGMMEQQSQTLLGRWSTLKDNLVRAITPLGQALLPVVGRIVDGLTVAAQVMGQFISDNRELAVVVAGAAAAIGAIGVTLVGFGLSLKLAAIGVLTTGALIKGLAVVIASPWIVGSAAIVGLLAHLGVFHAALKGIGDWFGQFGPLVAQTWDGVKAAIQGGDLQAAMGVLTAGLNVAWADVTSQMTAAWYGFTGSIRENWAEASHAIATGWTAMFFDVQQAWESTSNMMGQAGDSFTSGLINGFDYLMGLIDRMFNVLSQFAAKFNQYLYGISAEDTNAAIQRLEDQYVARAEARQQEMDTRSRGSRVANEGRQEQSDQRRAALQQSAQRYFGELNAIAREERQQRGRAQAGALAAARQRLVDARQELTRQTAQAEQSQEERKQAAAAAAKKRQEQASSKTSSAGAFNVRSVAQTLGIGAGQDRVAKATERTAKAAEQLVDQADNGGLVFGGP